MSHTVSVCIPTYEMHGKGATFLRQSFEVLAEQTFRDFDVVVSDHSVDGSVERVCQEFGSLLDIRYLRNTEQRGNSSANLNNALRHATGRILKILFQDDYLATPDSLERTVTALGNAEGRWLVSACKTINEHDRSTTTYHPRFNDRIAYGNNTIGPPSVLAIARGKESLLMFDENLIWLMDCDYYQRCYEKFGKPLVLNEITVVNRTGDHQITSTRATQKLRRQEERYIIAKYASKHSTFLPSLITRVKRYADRNKWKDLLRSVIWKNARKSYSQSGEDLIVQHVFSARGVERPTYIDIGAHHPERINNTKIFYDKGSRGINVEPDPQLFKCFERSRRRDINLNIGVSSRPGTMKYYQMEAPTLNTFSQSEAIKLEEEEGIPIIGTLSIPVRTITSIIEEYCNGKCPDFLSLDTEGMDEAILHSLDFKQSSPIVICVETISYSTKGRGRKDTNIIRFLENNGFLAYADTNINTIFVRRDFWEI